MSPARPQRGPLAPGAQRREGNARGTARALPAEAGYVAVYLPEHVRVYADRAIGNLAAAHLDQLAQAVRRNLKKIQYRPHLVNGCLAGAGLSLV